MRARDGSGGWMRRILSNRLAVHELLGQEHLLPRLWPWFVLTFGGVFATLLITRSSIPPHRWLWATAALGACAPALAIAIRLRRSRPTIAHLIIAVVFSAAVLNGVWLVGPAYAVSVAAITAVVCVGIVALPARDALTILVIVLVGYGFIVSVGSGYPQPAARIVFVTTMTLSSAGVLAWVMDLVRTLAEDQRRIARKNEELAEALHDANQQLQHYVAPQVASAVRDRDTGTLGPHRRQIAVVFVDLRGFTRFNAGAEPEDVVDVLSEYYDEIGNLASTHEATIGSYAGDGIMAYFGDPTPIDDPVGSAFAYALAVRSAMAEWRTRWSRRGFDLGAGSGVAYGYATLGTIGFGHRREVHRARIGREPRSSALQRSSRRRDPPRRACIRHRRPTGGPRRSARRPCEGLRGCGARLVGCNGLTPATSMRSAARRARPRPGRGPCTGRSAAPGRSASGAPSRPCSRGAGVSLP